MSAGRTTKQMRAEFVAGALGGVRQSVGQWLAPCPVPTHGKGNGDRNPSLSVRHGPRDGQVLVHCFAGCSNDDVIAALRARGLWCDSPSVAVARREFRSADQGPGSAAEAARRTELALNVWRSSIEAPGTLVETYLRSRGITDPPPPTLRFSSTVASFGWRIADRSASTMRHCKSAGRFYRRNPARGSIRHGRHVSAGIGGLCAKGCMFTAQ